MVLLQLAGRQIHIVIISVVMVTAAEDVLINAANELSHATISTTYHLMQ